MDGSDIVEPTTKCPLGHGVRFHTSFGGRSNRELTGRLATPHVCSFLITSTNKNS